MARCESPDLRADTNFQLCNAPHCTSTQLISLPSVWMSVVIKCRVEQWEVLQEKPLPVDHEHAENKSSAMYGCAFTCFSQASNPYHLECRSRSRALRDSPPVCTGGHRTHLEKKEFGSMSSHHKTSSLSQSQPSAQTTTVTDTAALGSVILIPSSGN